MREKAGVERPAILLDLDNTILDFNTAERFALKRALNDLGLPFDERVLSLYHVLNIQHWEMLEDGLLTRDQVLVKRFEALYRELGLKDRLDTMSEDEQLRLLASDGMLVKRPLLVSGRAVIPGFREKDWEAVL